LTVAFFWTAIAEIVMFDEAWLNTKLINPTAYYCRWHVELEWNAQERIERGTVIVSYVLSPVRRP
jgi:hypothetical protein